MTKIAAPRTTVFASSHLTFGRAELVWEILLFSLLLDPFIPRLLSKSPISPSLADVLAGAAAASAVTATALLFFNPLLHLSERLLKLREHLARHENRWWSVALVALLVGGLMIDLAVRVLPFGPKMLVGAVVVALGAGFSIWRTVQETRVKWRELVENRRRWIEHIHLQIFMSCVVPLVCARAVSPLVLFALSRDQNTLTYDGIVAMLVSGVLLIAHRPHRNGFVTLCPRCRRQCSRAMAILGGCPECSPQLYQPPPNVTHPEKKH